MHLHKDNIETLLKSYLPAHYSTEAVERLSKKGIKVSAGVVRNARNGRRTANKAAILSVLVEMAQELRDADVKLSNMVNTIS